MRSIYPFTILFFFSCSQSQDTKVVFDMDKDNSKDLNKNITADSMKDQSNIPEGWIQIEIDNITYLVEKIDMNRKGIDNSINDQDCSFSDTAYFDLLPGDLMEDKMIKTKDSKYQILEMYVQEVNGIGVNSQRIIEVPFCVLSNWKTSYSDWIPIQSKESTFRFKTYDYIDSNTLKFDLTELKTGIKNSCGEDWFNEFKDVDSLKNISFNKTIIQYNYKMICRDLESGKIFENVIVFYVPTSC